MTVINILGFIGLGFIGILMMGLAFLGTMVVLKVIWFARHTPRAAEVPAPAPVEPSVEPPSEPHESL